MSRLVFVVILALGWFAPLPAQGSPSLLAPGGKWHIPPVHESTGALSLADFDADGRLDLAIGNAGSTRDRLLFNQGGGWFTDRTAACLPSLAAWTFGLAAGDVDGDGDQDLLAMGGSSALYINSGSGTMTNQAVSRLAPGAGLYLRSGAFGDVDGDGDLDLVAFAGGGTGCLYLNDGKGFFTDATRTRFVTNLEYGTQVLLVDVDGDGGLDVMGATNKGCRLYLNDGLGVFRDASGPNLPPGTWNVGGIDAGDVDGDGDPDLVCAVAGGPNRLLLNQGKGVFATAPTGRLPRGQTECNGVVLGDFDLDGDRDLLFCSPGEAQELYLNDGAGVFTLVADRLPLVRARASSIKAGDVDGDGDLDVVLGVTGGPDQLWLNDGAARFAMATGTVNGVHAEETNGLAVGDVNGDGHADVIYGSWNAVNRLFLGDGGDRLLPAPAGSLPAAKNPTTALVLADMDGDGDRDLLVGNQGANELLLNNGRGRFTPAPAGALPPGNHTTFALVSGDVNGDGNLDLICGNWGEQNRLLLGSGAGSFVDATATGMPVDADVTLSLTLLDVDGDGDLDLYCGNVVTDKLYLGDGKGRFSDTGRNRLPALFLWTITVTAGDLDGDGDTDLVVGHTTGQDRILLNDGRGYFSLRPAADIPNAMGFTTVTTLFDVDGDGDLDLALGKGSVPNITSVYRQDYLFLNDGTGRFQAPLSPLLPVQETDTHAMAAADLDGDGDLDLILGCKGTNRILYNHRRQASAPLLLRVGMPYRVGFHLRPALPGSLVVPCLSDGPARTSLPPLGTLGLRVSGLVLLPPLPIPSSTAPALWRFTVPRSPALLHMPCCWQGLVVADPVGNLPGARFTNVLVDRVSGH